MTVQGDLVTRDLVALHTEDLVAQLTMARVEGVLLVLADQSFQGQVVLHILARVVLHIVVPADLHTPVRVDPHTVALAGRATPGPVARATQVRVGRGAHVQRSVSRLVVIGARLTAFARRAPASSRPEAGCRTHDPALRS